MLLKYNLPETARYLGYKRGAKPSEVICELIDEAYDELCKIVDPKYIFMEYDFSQTENSIVVKGVEFKSRKLLNPQRLNFRCAPGSHFRAKCG